jgi:hypothetical protein
MVAGRDPDGAGGLVAQVAERLELGLDLLEPGSHGLDQALARFGRRDTAGCAGEQPKPQTRFQSADGVAERRLRDTELRCGLGETALTADDHESQKIIEMAALHS